MPKGVILNGAASPARLEVGVGGAVLLHVTFEGGQVQADGTLERRKIVVRLEGGPCDGEHATVIGYGTRCWQRIPGKLPYWALYVRSARGVYTWAEDEPDNIIGLTQMREKIAAQGADRVAGSYGA